MAENETAHKVEGFPDKDLALKISAYEDFINESTHKLIVHLMRSANSMSYEDIGIAVEGFKALEDYIIVKRVLRLKCLDDAIYFLIVRDLAEILDDVNRVLMENRPELKSRIDFRLWLFKRDIYEFIKDCPHFRS